jgi:hypothetical protein
MKNMNIIKEFFHKFDLNPYNFKKPRFNGQLQLAKSRK